MLATTSTLVAPSSARQIARGITTSPTLRLSPFHHHHSVWEPLACTLWRVRTRMLAVQRARDRPSRGVSFGALRCPSRSNVQPGRHRSISRRRSVLPTPVSPRSDTTSGGGVPNPRVRAALRVDRPCTHPRGRLRARGPRDRISATTLRDRRPPRAHENTTASLGHFAMKRHRDEFAVEPLDAAFCHREHALFQALCLCERLPDGLCDLAHEFTRACVHGRAPLTKRGIRPLLVIEHPHEGRGSRPRTERHVHRTRDVIVRELRGRAQIDHTQVRPSLKARPHSERGAHAAAQRAFRSTLVARLLVGVAAFPFLVMTMVTAVVPVHRRRRDCARRRRDCARRRRGCHRRPPCAA